MTYQTIENFAAGLDTRKSPLTSPAGTMTRIVNAVITPGGEISKRRAFVNLASVSGTFGLAATESSIYVFGKNVTPSLPTWPTSTLGVQLKGLSVPNTATDMVQTDYDIFDGKVYLVCSVPSGADANAKNPHYYDVPMVLTEGKGKGFYVRTYQSKVYSITGKFLYFSAVGNPLIWDSATVISSVAVTGLSNTNPARVTVGAADISKFTNGKRVMVSGADTTHANANGSHTVSSVGTPANTFLLDDVDCTAAAGTQATGVTIDNAPTTGRGYINISLQDADAEVLTSIEVYYDKLAIFSTESVQIWAVDPDPAQNAFTQLLRAAGTSSPRSPLQYGSGDVLFLDPSGVRSVKAKDSSNSAAVSDIGSPVDPTVQVIRGLQGGPYMDKAISLLEPSVGRFWMVFPTQILVLSYFPGPKITAWSQFTLPELGAATIQHAVTSGGKVFLRDSADNIWVYGGVDSSTFNNCGVEIRLPYLDGKKPGHRKLFQGFDATVSGTWRVAVSLDFNNPDAEETIATITQPTWNAGRIEQQGYDSHFSMRFYNDDALPATISNCAVHYEMADAED